MRASPLTDTVSPVAVAELQHFLDVDSTDTLDDMLSIATDAVIRYLNRELLPRQWQLVINRRMEPVTVRYNRFPDRQFGWVELPYSHLLSVDSVEVDGDAVDHDVDILSTPGRVYVDQIGEQLEVVYTAGSVVIPASIKTGIKMLAAFYFEHAGACDVTDALHKSGAEAVLRPYRVEW